MLDVINEWKNLLWNVLILVPSRRRPGPGWNEVRGERKCNRHPGPLRRVRTWDWRFFPHLGLISPVVTRSWPPVSPCPRLIHSSLRSSLISSRPEDTEWPEVERRNGSDKWWLKGSVATLWSHHLSLPTPPFLPSCWPFTSGSRPSLRSEGGEGRMMNRRRRFLPWSVADIISALFIYLWCDPLRSLRVSYFHLLFEITGE